MYTNIFVGFVTNIRYGLNEPSLHKFLALNSEKMPRNRNGATSKLSGNVTREVASSAWTRIL